MTKLKSVLSALLCVLLCTLLLTGCSGKNSVTDTTTPASGTSTNTAVHADNLESRVDFENAIQIDLNSTTAPESGVSIKDSVFTISRGGTYIISGNLNGQVLVNADKQDVWLVLDSAHITCEDNAPLYIEDAKNTYLIIRSGSENSLTDGSTYDVAADADPDATLFCKNDLIIGGGGSLTIDSNYNNALHTKDTLTINSGNITIDSVDTGIKAKDGLTIAGGNLSVTSAGDGIQTTNAEESDKGSMLISGGNITVESQKDAIQSENSLTISGGNFDLKTGGGAENADYKYNSPMGGFRGGYEDDSTDVSMKALKAQGTLTVTNGSFSINSEDDALHSNSDVTVSGGTFSIATGDDGIHADSVTTIDGGDITITTSYEGIEGSEVYINDGTIHLTASDDGVNSAGGGDTGYGGFGPDSFGSSSDYKLSINGGYLYVDAGGDGLDSNGSITVCGGLTIVNGPTDNGNSPFDWERECTVSGGTFIAAGSAGMMETVSSASTQCCLAVNMGNTLQGNTIVSITDGADFNLSFAPAKNYSYIFVISPDLTEGTDYSVYTGGSHSGNATDGLYSDGTYSAGELLTTITQSNIVTTYGSSFGGMGGGMGHGGMGSGGGRGW